MMSRTGSTAKFVCCIALLLATAVFLHSRQRMEVIPQAEDLTSFPNQLGTWVGTDMPIGDDVLEVLGPGHFLSRFYSEGKTAQPIDFFVAYFPSQKTGDTIHSPKNCLPGAGWVFSDSATMDFPRQGQKPLQINRYIISKGNSRQMVLYWYQAHGRGVASEYWAKFYLVADSIRMNRSDGALVRIITSVAPDEPVASAEKRALEFAGLVVPEIPRFIPN